MLNEGTTEYPFTLSRNGLRNVSNYEGDDKQLVQKWVEMVNQCLEQQWKDSQQLLGCAKALKNSSNHNQWDLDMIVKELSYLELGIIQRFIDLRQELVNHAYPVDLLDNNNDLRDKKMNIHSAGGGVGNPSAYKSLDGNQRWSSSCYMSLPSSPESDIYEPLLSKVNTFRKSTASNDYDNDDNAYDDLDQGTTIIENGDKRSSDITGDSPFTIHSKIWKHHRLQQKQPDSVTSSSSSSNSSSILLSSPKHLRSLLAPSSSAPVIHELSQQEDLSTKTGNRCSPNFTPACTYNYYPSSNKRQQSLDDKNIDLQQCQHCFFCRSSMPKQKSLSLNEPARSVLSDNSSSSSSSSFIASNQRHDCHTSTRQQSSEEIDICQLPSPPQSVPIPIRTSSSLDTAAATPFMISTSAVTTPTITAPAPKAAASNPILGTSTLASHITPSIPSSSSSMVHTMSTRFHFKRNIQRSKNKSSPSTTASCHHCTTSVIPSANSNNVGNEHGKSSSRFVRSLMHRKVSFPTFFSSNNKKVHPDTTISNNNNDDRLTGSSFLL